ncbi:MAG: precorrin-3B synthase [Methylovirgula sp.]
MSIAHRRGWCPGALRPMESGDGLIVRLRIIGGALAPALARALAQCADDYGNGLIDLSARGNLQLRGVAQATLPALQARLDALGLLDADPGAEAVRNILASPLAALDPSALLDIRPQIQALDERLRSDRALHRLSGKFLFLIDDGGRLPLAPELADIAFMARPGNSGPFFAIDLGGVLAGCCAIDEMCDTAARLAYAFLQLCGEGKHRMSDLIRRIGTETIARAAGLADMPKGISNPQRHEPRPLGLHPLGPRSALGLGIAFGRLDAKALHMLADEAEAAGGEIRLSPWRAVFLVAERFDPEVAARMQEPGFILDEDAPIRAVAACPGRPSCLHGATSSQADRARLAPLARGLAASGIALHVSACAKGCAHPRLAPVTLIGRESAYDLVLDGRAGDAPLLRGLDLPAIETLLQRLAAIAPADRATFARQFFCEAER